MTDAELVDAIRGEIAMLDVPGCGSVHDALVAVAGIRSLLGWPCYGAAAGFMVHVKPSCRCPR